MFTVKKTSSSDADFQKLAWELDQDLAIKNGEKNVFFAQYNKSDELNHVLVAYIDEEPVGCGALKEYDRTIMEIKRMYVRSNHRGKGLSKAILMALTTWAKELGYLKCILETGEQMTEAIALYKRNGFEIIPNYGQYAKIEDSICFEKQLWKAL